MRRAIDLGCGTGRLVSTLARRAVKAEGIDLDADVIVYAEQAHDLPNVTFSVQDLLDCSSAGQYDAVAALASLHHLPLTDALEKSRSLLAPKGTLVVLGCYLPTTTADRAVEALAVPANMIMGLWKSWTRSELHAPIPARTAPASMSLDEVRQVAAQVLPGARIRRRLFWRYSLVYRERPVHRSNE